MGCNSHTDMIVHCQNDAGSTSERPRLSNASVLVTVDAVDGSVELVAEAEVGYPLTSLDEIGVKRPSLEPLRRRFKAIAVNLHGIAPFFWV